MNTTTIKMKLLALCFLISGSLIAQQKLTKVLQSIKVDKDVTIDLNTSHCNIVFDTWNKDTVEIEAYIEGEQLSKVELENTLKSWGVDIDASSDNVSIRTTGKHSNIWTYNIPGHGDDDAVHAVIKELKFELADMPDMPEMDFDFHVEMPEMPEMPELPELPEGVNNIEFDYDAYKKDGEKYLEKYTEKFESLYGEDYAKKMEAWAEKFEDKWNEEDYVKKMEAWGEKFDEEWGEEFGERMAEWGEHFAKKMEGQVARIEAQAERMAAKAEHENARKAHVIKHKEHIKERSKLVEERQKKIEELVHGKTNSNVKKTIKIKMPKKAKLKVNVRYGEIEFAANIDNLKADLSHTKFTAYSINGSSTSINASYSPVFVTHWNLGELNLNYVRNAELENVSHLVLNAISSEVDIQNLTGSAVVDGNIGDIEIYKIADSFNNLNIILQNSNAVISLPKVDCNMQYKGIRSRLSHPKKGSKENPTNFSTGNLASGKSIVVNAKYSNVVMQ
ncbi:hypothetical protein GCM10023311_27070 [Flaviramulus aquimarinus]|uniref:Adhesin domain-containing protein n=1 Tax=Flaviramulus aquimarinus TaxID=1170456 RepID=A0ABP9FES3_9FLAO